MLDWFEAHQRADGLLGTIPWWPFVDWTTDFERGVPPQMQDGGSAVLTLQYLEALENAAVLEAGLGDAQRAEHYRKQAARLRKVLLQETWDAKAGLLADTPELKHYSQQANALAVMLDVIPEAQQAAVMRKILTVMPGMKPAPAISPASYYFRFYLTKAMVHAGLGDQYVPQLEPWRTMLGLGLSTWAEQPEPTRSDSHAWSAHPTYDLATVVAGIRPGAPGFKTVELEPHLGGLSQVQATMPTPVGDVSVQYTKEGAGWKATVALPETISGRLVWKGEARALHGGVQTLALR